MTLLAALSRTRDPAEGRAISPSMIPWGRGDDLENANSAAGVRVDRDTALGVSAVWACVSLIADSVATLPLDTYTRDGNLFRPYRPRPAWLDQPNPEQTCVDFIFGTVASLLLDGNAFIYTIRDRRGDVAEAWLLDPRWVDVRREPQPNGSLGLNYYVTVGKGMQSPVGPFKVPAGPEMFHIMAFQPNSSWPRGVSPLESARMMLGSGIAGQEMGGRFFGQGFNAPGVIEHPEDMLPEQARQLKEDFTRANSGLRKMHLPPVLTGGAKFTPMGVSPEQAQFIEQRKFSVDEIARFFRVPPHMIGNLEKSTSWGTGIEQQSIGFVKYTLRPWLERIEESWTRNLLIFQPGVSFRFDVDSLMRGDSAAQADYALKRFQTGWTHNDVRAFFGEQPIDKGDVSYFPVNMAPVGTEPLKIQKVDATDAPDAGDEIAGDSSRSLSVPAITIEIPPIEMPAIEIPPANITVNVPEQRAPVVNVEAPQVRLALPPRRRAKRTVELPDGRKATVTEEEEEV